MPYDSKVLAALQHAHNLEATASEKWHKQEHACVECGAKYRGLKKYFDRRHKEAYQRQHCLRNAIMRAGGTVGTDLGDTSYRDDVGKPEGLKAVFDDAAGIFGELMGAHQAVNDTSREAAKSDGDPAMQAEYRGIREKFHGYAKDLGDSHRKAVKKRRLIDDLGPELFLAKHL